MAKTPKKKKQNPRMTKLAAYVLAETSFHTGAGMESAMQGRDYFLNPKARAFWLDGHAISIPLALKRKNANWDRDRGQVTQRARDLGSVAGELALKAAPPSGLVEVTEEHVDKASKQVRKDPRCRAAKIGPGGGPFCEF